MSESGDNKLIGNFRKLIDEVSADPDYNPGADNLKIPALEAKYTAGDSAVSSVNVARAPYKLAVVDRESAFKSVRPIAVRSRNYMKASGAPKGVIASADTFVRKLGGGRKTPKPPAGPAAPESGPGTPGSGPPAGEPKGPAAAPRRR